MDELEYSERLASIARIVGALGGDTVAGEPDRQSSDASGGLGRSGGPSPVLIDELASLVARLQRDLSYRQPGWRKGGRAGGCVVEPSVAGELPAVAVAELWVRDAASDVTDLATSPISEVGGFDGGHGVHFARSHEHAVAAVVDMICEAIDHGRAVVLVTTALHRRWIDAELQQRGAQLDRDDFHILDATATLSSLLVDGRPDHECFRARIGALLTDVAAHAAAGVSVYGEMVGLLWEQGDVASALRLEELWNDLRREVAFSLMCGYILDGRSDSSDLDPIRRLHTHVS